MTTTASWMRCWMGRLSFWVVWDSFVRYISDETVVVISGIGDSLDTAIGKVYLVRSMYGFAVSGFSSLEVGSRVVISYSIFESVWFWGFFILSWGMVWSWSWGISWFRGMVWSWGWGISWFRGMIWSWSRGVVRSWCMVWCWLIWQLVSYYSSSNH